MWESGALAIGRSQFLRNLGVLLNNFSNLWDDFENSFTGGGVLAGALFGGVVESVGGLIVEFSRYARKRMLVYAFGRRRTGWSWSKGRQLRYNMLVLTVGTLVMSN